MYECFGHCAGRRYPKKHNFFSLNILRAGGLIETVQSGREMINSLRRDEFDRRFPGLLQAVLTSVAS
jgi:hypothetical protein